MRSKPITIILITLIFVAAICFFLIRPVATSIWASWKGLQQARNDLVNLAEKKQILEALKNNQDLSNVGEIVLKYIPNESDSGELVVELAAIANNNNLKVEEMSMEKSQETKTTEETKTPTPKSTPLTQASPTTSTTGGAKEVDFSLKLSGTYTDLVNFLWGVESSSRLISLKNVAFQMSTTAGQEQNLSAQIKGVAYYKPDVTLQSTLDNIKVSQETIEKFLNLKTFGSPINLPTESGFGRTNPFENY